MRALVFIALSLYAISHTTQAKEGFNNTLDLINKCSPSDTSEQLAQYQEIQCLGYLAGLSDGIQILFSVRPESKFFCPPTQGISPEAFIQIIKKWVKNNPKYAQESARMTVLIAYGKEFPCN